MSDSLEAKITELHNKINELTNKIDTLSQKAGSKVAWQDQVSDSGIQLTGSATIERRGVVIGTFAFPTSPSQIALMFIVKRDGDNSTLMVDAKACAFID